MSANHVHSLLSGGKYNWQLFKTELLSKCKVYTPIMIRVGFIYPVRCPLHKNKNLESC